MTDALLKSLVSISRKYGKDKSELLARKFDEIESVTDFSSVLLSMRTWMETKDLESLEYACRESAEMETKKCAVALRSAIETMETINDVSNVDLVWTGPSTPLVMTRRTEQVLIETIEHAKKKLFIVSYVAYDVDSIVQALRSAIRRGVKVEILMESTGDYGGRISMDSIALFQKELPEAILYWWDLEGASVHAKCAVADAEVAFVTSANLTGAAMQKNMELGVKIVGGDIPKQLHNHLEALVVTRKITEVE